MIIMIMMINDGNDNNDDEVKITTIGKLCKQ